MGACYPAPRTKGASNGRPVAVEFLAGRLSAVESVPVFSNESLEIGTPPQA